jgi:hypothetical protein
VYFESKYDTNETFGNAGPEPVSAPKKPTPIDANQVIRRRGRRIECARKLSKL